MFGKNIIGGVLKVIWFCLIGEFGVKVFVGYGFFEYGCLCFVVNVLVVLDLIVFKFGGIFNNWEGYIDNVFFGLNEGFVEYKVVNVEVFIILMEGFDILLGYDFIEDRSGFLFVEFIFFKDDEFIGFGDFGGDV